VVEVHGESPGLKGTVTLCEHMTAGESEWRGAGVGQLDAAFGLAEAKWVAGWHVEESFHETPATTASSCGKHSRCTEPSSEVWHAIEEPTFSNGRFLYFYIMMDGVMSLTHVCSSRCSWV